MKKELFKFLILLIVAIGSAPLSAQVYKWSTTASNNATADPSIDWSEGQSPSSINDSARAMMAGIALWRKDNSGSTLNLVGGPVTYTMTSNEGFTSAALMANATFSFYVFAANGINPTLNVDGLGDFPILSSIGTPLAAGSFIVGGHYTATFSNAISSFIVENFYANSFSVSLGQLISSTLPNPPNANFLPAGGQCISTATYAAYWGALGSPASGACPGGQFAILDMRGRAPVGLDNIAGTPAGRLTNSGTGCGTAMTSMGASCSNGLQSQTLSLAQIPAGITSAGAALAVSGATTVNLLYNGNTAQNLQAGTNGFGWSNSPTVGTAALSGTTAAQSVTSNNTGGGAHPTIDPNVAVYYYVRVL